MRLVSSVKSLFFQILTNPTKIINEKTGLFILDFCEKFGVFSVSLAQPNRLCYKVVTYKDTIFRQNFTSLEKKFYRILYRMRVNLDYSES